MCCLLLSSSVETNQNHNQDADLAVRDDGGKVSEWHVFKHQRDNDDEYEVNGVTKPLQLSGGASALH